jgi:predicted enzyme involved in methoxymalonyl-ACP biosynthesis
MLSCRVEGRGIPAALLRWIMGGAKDAGKRGLKAVYRVSERNLPVRLLFRQMGFQTVGGHGLITVTRDLTGRLPDYPEWLRLDVVPAE